MNLNWIVLPTLIIAVLLFAVGQWSIRRCRTPKGKIGVSVLWFILGIPGFLFPLYYLHWFDNAVWFYQFRAFPFVELTAAGTGLFAGALAELVKGSKKFSRGFLAAILCLGILAPHVKPLLGSLPIEQFSDHWQDDVCLQSTSSSCGLASAATIFRTFGIHLSEQQLAEECFTYRGGTENWYLARAFRRRGYRVRFRIDDGLPADLQTPAIAGVRVGDAGHFIAIIDNSDGVYITGDPLVGRQQTPADRIEKEYLFTGFFMEIKKEAR